MPSFPTPVGSPGAAQGPYHGFGYEWENNHLGDDHSVPPPWTPVRIKGTQVEVWNRAFAWSRNGPWLAEISSGKQALLARPLTISLKTDAGQAAWKGAPQSSQDAGDSAQIRWRGQEAGLEIAVAASVEFDGFFRNDITLKPSTSEITVNQLVIEIPLAKEAAKFFSRGYSYDFVKQKASVANWRGEIGETAGLITGDRIEPFVHHYWIGNEQAGLELNLPTDFDWSLAPAGHPIEIRANGEATSLKVNLITQPKVIRGETRYTFALLVTPSKPLMLNDWRQYIFPGSTVNNPLRKLDHNFWKCYPILFEGSLPFETWGLPVPPQTAEKRAKFDAQMAIAAKNGLRVIPYASACLMSTNAPGFAQYRPYWLTSVTKLKKGRGDDVMVSLYAKSIRDFLIYQQVQAAQQVPAYQGLYFDVADIAENVTNPNANEYDLQKQPEANFKPLYEMRDFYKRIYRVAKSIRPDYLVTMHQGKLPEVFGAFTDFLFSGEGLNAHFLDLGRAQAKAGKLLEGQPPYLADYASLSDGFWQASYAPKGYVNVFLPQVTKTFPGSERFSKMTERDWQKWFTAHPEYVERHTRAMFSRILMFDVLRQGARCDGNTWDAVAAAFEELGGLANDLRHIPYWEAGSFVNVDQGKLLFTAYCRSAAGKAMVIAANWSDQPRQCRTTINPKALGANQRSPKCHITDLEKNRVLPAAGAGAVELLIPANDYRILLVE